MMGRVINVSIVSQLWFFETQPSGMEAADTFVLQPVVPGLNMPLVIPFGTFKFVLSTVAVLL